MSEPLRLRTGVGESEEEGVEEVVVPLALRGLFLVFLGRWVEAGKQHAA